MTRILSIILLAACTSHPAYDRHDWRHWVDADGDCQDTRQEVLIAESEVPVTFQTSLHCRVATGRWTCPYTGHVYTDPSQLDVDHLVPLRNAHESGGWRWDAERRKRFANDLTDLATLVAVSRSSNRSKGAKAPDAWLPERDQCAYLEAWRSVKARWDLEMAGAEKIRHVDAYKLEANPYYPTGKRTVRPLA